VAAFVSCLCWGHSVYGAIYNLEQVSTPGNLIEVEHHVPGLHVGSMLAFKANCINVDIEGVTDSRGSQTVPGALFALVADESPAALAESPLSDGDSKRLYFLQHDGTQRFPFRNGRFEWIIAEHFIEHISYHEAIAFLTEARRLLAPGGTLRLSTPDMAIYAAAFFDPSQVPSLQRRHFDSYRCFVFVLITLGTLIPCERCRLFSAFSRSTTRS
jgi:hypothetical protein